MSSYLGGVDIGGTFTDSSAIDGGGHVASAKAVSTPGNFAQRMPDAQRVTGRCLELLFDALCRQIRVFNHATTVRSNTPIRRKETKVDSRIRDLKWATA